MGINAEKLTIQEVNGSPAQIQTERISLANVVFGSNSACLEWCAKFTKINAGPECRNSGDFKDRGPGADVHTHAHTRTHA